MIPWFPLCRPAGFFFSLSWAAGHGTGNDGKEMESEGTVPMSRYEDAPVVVFAHSLFFHWMLPASRLLEHQMLLALLSFHLPSLGVPWGVQAGDSCRWLEMLLEKQPLVRELTLAFIYFPGVNTALRMQESFADVPSEFWNSFLPQRYVPGRNSCSQAPGNAELLQTPVCLPVPFTYNYVEIAIV